MLELSSHEVVCPVCKTGFFPETSANNATLCGKHLHAYTGRLAKILDCKIHYFCSKDCSEKFQEQMHSSEKISRWKLLLEKIYRDNTEQGIRGFRYNDLYRKKPLLNTHKIPGF